MRIKDFISPVLSIRKITENCEMLDISFLSPRKIVVEFLHSHRISFM